MRSLIVGALVVGALDLEISAAESEVSGIFKGNDQPAKLMCVSAHKGSPVGGKETIKLLFTEKGSFERCATRAESALRRLWKRPRDRNSGGWKGRHVRRRARGAQTETNQFAYVD
jgi:hypothetical protein